jgi:hypothetical protein
LLQIVEGYITPHTVLDGLERLVLLPQPALECTGMQPQLGSDALAGAIAFDQVTGNENSDSCAQAHGTIVAQWPGPIDQIIRSKGLGQGAIFLQREGLAALEAGNGTESPEV